MIDFVGHYIANVDSAALCSKLGNCEESAVELVRRGTIIRIFHPKFILVNDQKSHPLRIQSPSFTLYITLYSTLQSLYYPPHSPELITDDESEMCKKCHEEFQDIVDTITKYPSIKVNK